MFARCFRRFVESATLHSGHARQHFLRCSPYLAASALASVVAEDDNDEMSEHSELGIEDSSDLSSLPSDNAAGAEKSSSDEDSEHGFRYSSNEWINSQLNKLMDNEKLRNVMERRMKMSDVVHSVQSAVNLAREKLSTKYDSDESSNEGGEQAEIVDEQGTEEEPTPLLPRIFEERPVRIAVVGAGIGGSSCAYFLNESLNECLTDERGQPFTIDVFDSNNREGGRLLSQNLGGFAAERGAGIMIDENKYMLEFTDLLHLRREYRSDTVVAFYNSPMGKLDGDRLDTTTLRSTYSTLRHFGFIRFFKLQRIAKEFIGKFGKIYNLQSEGEAFESVWDLYDAMGLADRFEGNGLQWLMEDGMKITSYSPIISQLVTGLSRANYGQNPENMTPLSLMTSVAPMASGSVWHVKDGNMAVPKALLDQCDESNVKGNVRRRMNTRVKSITKRQSSSLLSSSLIEDIIGQSGLDCFESEFSVASVDQETGEERSDAYDYVILATPITTANIDFNGMNQGSNNNNNKKFDQLLDFYNRQLYHTTYVYWIRGLLNPKFFGLDQWDFNCLSQLGCILHSNTNGRPRGDETRKHKLNSWQIADGYPRPGLAPSPKVAESNQRNGRYDKSVNSERPGVWQAMQTSDEMSEEELNEMYYMIDEMKVSRWKAYPNYQWLMDEFQLMNEEEKRDMLTFVLDNHGLYYVNSVECGTSAQEVCVVGSKNVANLITKSIRKLNEHDEEVEQLEEMVIDELVELVAEENGEEETEEE